MAERGPGDGLLRWIFAGVAIGAVMLGLLAAAYAIGRSQGSGDSSAAAPAATAPAATAPAAPAPTAPAQPEKPAEEPQPSSAALVAAGKESFASAGCAGCHSLDGSPGVGPSLKGIAGAQVTLSDGRTVVADPAYLAQSIAEPDAAVVDGYRAGSMPALGLDDDEVAALVAYLDSGP